ncbi:MAG: CAP domain-containing protein [Acidobacteriota bacterium]
MVLALALVGCTASPPDPAEAAAPGLTPPADSEAADRSTDLDSELWTLVESHRESRDRPPLERVGSLDALAAGHSAAMLRSQQLSHDGSAERFERIRQSLSSLAAAENVAMACGHGPRTAQTLFEGWRESDGHRRNLEGDFDVSGISVASDGECAFATQLFGKTP